MAGSNVLARPRGSGPRTRPRRRSRARRPPGRERARRSGRRPPVSSRPPSSPNPPWHRQMAASNSPSNGRGRARRAPRTSRRGRRRPPPRGRAARSPATWSTPTTSQPAPGQRERVAPGPHPTSSTRIPGSQPERVDEELDLLLGALRERVPQVRRPEEVGDRVEPVRRRRYAGARSPSASGTSPARSAVTSPRPSWGRSRCRRRAGRAAR